MILHISPIPHSPSNIIGSVLGPSSCALVDMLPHTWTAVNYPEYQEIAAVDHELVLNDESGHTPRGHKYRQQSLEEQRKERVYSKYQRETVLHQELCYGGTVKLDWRERIKVVK